MRWSATAGATSRAGRVVRSSVLALFVAVALCAGGLLSGLVFPVAAAAQEEEPRYTTEEWYALYPWLARVTLTWERADVDLDLWILGEEPSDEHPTSREVVEKQLWYYLDAPESSMGRSRCDGPFGDQSLQPNDRLSWREIFDPATLWVVVGHSLGCNTPPFVNPPTEFLVRIEYPDGTQSLHPGIATAAPFDTVDTSNLTVDEMVEFGSLGFHVVTEFDVPEWAPPAVTTSTSLPTAPTTEASTDNQPPEITALGFDPVDPSSDDTVVITIQATDPEDGPLSYRWTVDGEVQSIFGSQVVWSDPIPGDHVVVVVAIDDKGAESVESALNVRVSEHVGAGDRDDDGVPDDEDLCPDEWGIGDDGCPPFAATLGCIPTYPKPSDRAECTVQVEGVHVGETLNYEWYLAGGSVSSGSASWTWASPEVGSYEVLVDVIGEGRSTSARHTLDVTIGPAPGEKVDPVAQLGAAAVTAFLAGGWLWLEYLRAQREAGAITAAEAEDLRRMKPPPAPADEVELDYGEEETPEAMAARRQATGKRDIDEFMDDHPEYRRIYPKLFNPDGSINQAALAAMMGHFEKHGPNTEYAKQFAEEEKALRRFTDGFFEKHVQLWEYQEKVERPDGTIDRALLRKLVTWQRKYGTHEPKESPYAWVADGLTGTMQEVFTGMEEDGTTSWSSMVLRGLIGFASAGQSEWIYVPGDSMFRLKGGVDRGEEGLELYGKVAGGVVFDEVLGRFIGKGIEKGAGAVARRCPGLARSVGEFIDSASVKLNRPVFGGGKPAQLSAGMTAFKRQVAEALEDVEFDDAAVRQLFKNKGMKKLAQLEAGGHLTPEQAGKLVGFHDDLTRAAVRKGTVDAIDEFGTLYGVKPREVMVGNSGSVGPHRSVLTDADRTIVAAFGDDTLATHARAGNRFQVDAKGVATAAPDTKWAAQDLQGKFTSLHQKHVELNLNGADDFVTQHARKTGKTLGDALEDLRAKGIDVDAGTGVRLDAADMDTGSYSGFGSGAGPADSYPTGYTQARQAIQGETEVFRVGADGSVAKPYKTSGQALVDQNALNVRPTTGKLPTDPTRIGVGEMKPLLDQQKIAVGKYTDAKSVAKAIDRANYVAGRTGAPLPDRNVVDAAVQIRANPTATNRILSNHGISEQQFINAAKDMMGPYDPKLS